MIVSLYVTLRITVIVLYWTGIKGGYPRKDGDGLLTWWSNGLVNAARNQKTVFDPFQRSHRTRQTLHHHVESPQPLRYSPDDSFASGQHPHADQKGTIQDTAVGTRDGSW